MRGKILFGAVAVSLVFAGTALGADDFACYKTKDTAKAFAKTTATVVDTFGGSTATDFKKPFLLCDSASIAGDPQSAVNDRLSCFKVKGKKFDADQTLEVTDDFGTDRVQTFKKAFVVCDGQATTAAP
jgi:hypothetical protein